VQSLNLALFEFIGAGFAPHPLLLQLAAAIATGSSWLCVALLGWTALRRPPERFYVIAALLAAGVASVLAKQLAESIGMPRPFAIGLSPEHIAHGARAGLPSTHASVMFTTAFVLMLRRPLRDVGWIMAGIALATSWSRVYVGVHFPLDIAAGLLLGAAVAGALSTVWPWLQAQAATLTAVYGYGEGPSTALMPRRLVRLSRRLADGRIALWLALGCAAIAVAVGLCTPDFLPLSFLQEDGPVERSTIAVYLAAAALVLAVRVPGLARIDKAAMCIVLLALAAREADLHSAVYGMSILKARFYNQFASASQIAGALAMLAPIALSVAWLLRRYVSVPWASPARRKWWPATMTALTFVAVIVVAKCLDRLPATLLDFGLVDQVPLIARTLFLSLEEILELALPLLAILALAQARLGRRHDRPLPPPLSLPQRAAP
jgi:membrane-associated phospholipid phosphatase